MNAEDIFLEDYLKFIKKWKLFGSRFSRYLFKLNMASFKKLSEKWWIPNLEKWLSKRKELINLIEDKYDKEVIKCWIEMDRISLIFINQEKRSHKLRLKSYDIYEKFKKSKNFITARRLFNLQKKIFRLSKRLHGEVLYKMSQQERIKEIGVTVRKISNNKSEAIIIGVITDIITRNQNLVSTQASAIYALLKNLKPEIRNTLLLTKILKKSILKKANKLDLIMDDIKKLELISEK